jgi:hypothetical protein
VKNGVGGDGKSRSRTRSELAELLDSNELAAATPSSADAAIGASLAGAPSRVEAAAAEVVRDVAMMKKTIEGLLKSPEMAAKAAAAAIASGALSESDTRDFVKQMLEDAGIPPAALADGILMQKAMAALGVNADEFAAVAKLTQGLMDSGKSKVDAALILETLAAKGSSDPKSLAEALVSSLQQPGRKEDAASTATAFAGLAAALGADSSGIDPATLAKKLANAKTKSAAVDILEKELQKLNLSPDAVAKVLLVQKAAGIGSSNSKATPEDLAKMARLQAALMDGGVSPVEVSKLLAELSDSPNPSAAAKDRLSDVIKEGKLKIKSDQLDAASKFVAAMDPSTQHSDADVLAALERGMEAAGLTPEELAKAAAVQRTLAATGVSADDLSQLLLLQKSLAAAAEVARGNRPSSLGGGGRRPV